MNHHSHNKDQKECHVETAQKEAILVTTLKEKWVTYKPLIIILLFCLLIPGTQSYVLAHNIDSLMYSFMGYFFIFLSLFKFFDLKGFVEGFSTYDIITQRFRPYGYAYPFVELALGLSYLMKVNLLWVNVTTVILMTISGAGVVKSVLSGAKVKCACLGTALNVPLSTVSILENFGMGAMAAYKLLSHL